MTKKILITDIKEIKTLRIVCKNCGGTFSAPIKCRRPPEQCYSCGKDLPWSSINKLLKGIEQIEDEISNNKIDAYIETDEEF